MMKNMKKTLFAMVLGWLVLTLGGGCTTNIYNIYEELDAGVTVQDAGTVNNYYTSVIESDAGASVTNNYYEDAGTTIIYNCEVPGSCTPPNNDAGLSLGCADALAAPVLVLPQLSAESLALYQAVLDCVCNPVMLPGNPPWDLWAQERQDDCTLGILSIAFLAKEMDCGTGCGVTLTCPGVILTCQEDY